MSSYSDVHGAAAPLLDPELVGALADTFKVLGDRTRVRILDALSRQELCVGDIAHALGMSESAVSHQLRLLRNARLVRQRRAGQQMFYALDDHHVIRLFAQAYEHVQERAGVRPAAETMHPAGPDRPAASSPSPAGDHAARTPGER
jgi:DNA-binding transcriptional ArsR family regulator